MARMEGIIIAAFGLLSAVLTTLLGIWAARKLKIGPNQEILVSTLKDVVAAQSIRIDQLEADRKNDHKQIEKLSKEVADLRALTVEQAKTISHLTRELANRGGQ